MELDAHLSQLEALLTLSRAGAQFPDPRLLVTWLSFLRRRGPKGTAPPVALVASSGFPVRESLVKLLQQQRAARELLAEKGGKADSASPSYSLSLAAAELPAPSEVTARLIARERGQTRFLVVHDRLDEATGCPVRSTVVLSARSGAHFELGTRDDVARPLPAFARSVQQACAGTAQVAARMLNGLEGISVEEVVRGELGPFATEANARATALAPVPEILGAEAVLSLALERAGQTVTRSSNRDPLSPPPLPGEPQAAKERRFVCTPGLLEPLRAWARERNAQVVVRYS
ncbi:MAG: hypothetical protein K1X89_18815 [Myxococcaceae bacterium]|nr:hypothetical protein [Myxococcaceae bacterium]